MFLVKDEEDDDGADTRGDAGQRVAAAAPDWSRRPPHLPKQRDGMQVECAGLHHLFSASGRTSSNGAAAGAAGLARMVAGSPLASSSTEGRTIRGDQGHLVGGVVHVVGSHTLHAGAGGLAHPTLGELDPILHKAGTTRMLGVNWVNWIRHHVDTHAPAA